MSSFPGAAALANAISKLEGYGVSGAIPTDANNPGDLELGDLGYGTLGQGITVYPDTTSGMDALYAELDSIGNGTSKVYSPSTSIQDFGTTYSGGNSEYGTNLASALGVSPSTPIGDVLNGKTGSSSSYNPLTGTILNAIGANGLQSSIDSYVSNWVFSSRLIMLLIGILLIGAGLFSFKSTQTVIEKVGKAAKTATEVSA